MERCNRSHGWLTGMVSPEVLGIGLDAPPKAPERCRIVKIGVDAHGQTHWLWDGDLPRAAAARSLRRRVR